MPKRPFAFNRIGLPMTTEPPSQPLLCWSCNSVLPDVSSASLRDREGRPVLVCKCGAKNTVMFTAQIGNPFNEPTEHPTKH